ncbi:MAG: sugar ABC transporter ATP-binding protein [Thermogutta sp.]
MVSPNSGDTTTTPSATMAAPPRLSMEGICKRFGATVALENVNLEVRAGEVHALVGENGAGKSTLMRILSGATSPDRGSIWIDGQPFTPLHPLDARRHGIAMIYQELSLAPHLSVMENILLGIEPTRAGFIRWSEMKRRAQEALSELGLADLPLESPVRALPPGLQQMVEIARALVMQAKVVVLDEPTSSLAQDDVARLFRLVRRLQGRGLSVIYISHFLEEVKQISDRFTVLRDGHSVGTGPTATTPVNQMVQMMVGREVTELYPRRNKAPGEVVLDIKNLSGRDKPKDVSLSLRRGEILGIAGLIGSGRTELLRAIFGLDPVRRGVVQVGAFHGWGDPTKRWRQGIGFVSEDRKQEGLATGLSVSANITLPRLDYLGPMWFILPKRERDAARHWIQLLGIKCERPGQPIWALSGGNQQKVALSRLLYADVDVLILDEPTRGIDVGSKAQIYRLIAQAAEGSPEYGGRPKAVLMVSSYLPELLGLCDRIAVMYRGQLVACAKAEDWTEHKLMLAATGQNSEFLNQI